MGDLYAKSYKQLSGYKLPVATNKLVVTRLKCYPLYIESIERIKNKSETKLSEKDVARLCDYENLVNSINKALVFISADCRMAIKERLEDGTDWTSLSEKYSYSESYLKRQWQKYKYGVAIELGEDVVD